MAAAERDIELVLITGAGASRNLGAENEPLPLMPEFAQAIVRGLLDAGSSEYVRLAGLAGLNQAVDGPTFEAALGRFLAARTAFPLIADLVAASAAFSYQQYSQLSSVEALTVWYENVDHHLTQIEKSLWKSLYELFGAPRYDLARAREAYGDLLSQLGINRASRWVYATTNYDTIGESALQLLDHRVDWGARHQVRGGDPPVDVDELVDRIGRAVPVLHLHGKVGWYWRRDGLGPDVTAYETGSAAYVDGVGTPILMLPDPNKAYDSDDIISTLWKQFIGGLRRAKRVLVLGHSLHDRALVQALADNVTPAARIAICVLASASEPSQAASPDDDAIAIAQERFSGAMIVPMRFGIAPADASGRLSDWTERLLTSNFL